MFEFFKKILGFRCDIYSSIIFVELSNVRPRKVELDLGLSSVLRGLRLYT